MNREKINAKIERDRLFDSYLEGIDRIAHWKAGKADDHIRHTDRNIRRREMIEMIQAHVNGLSTRMRELDDVITGARHEPTANS